MNDQPARGKAAFLLFIAVVLLGFYMHQEGRVLPAENWTEFKEIYAPKPYIRR